MLETKIVVRLLSGDNILLGWAEVRGVAKGDGRIWVEEPTMIAVERAGNIEFLSVHWCDVNVEVRSQVERRPVKPGEIFQLPGAWPVITCGPQATGLPPVTVRAPIHIGVPVGGLGAKTN